MEGRENKALMADAREMFFVSEDSAQLFKGKPLKKQSKFEFFRGLTQGGAEMRSLSRDTDSPSHKTRGR
jgi:hypothetical protein